MTNPMTPTVMSKIETGTCGSCACKDWPIVGAPGECWTPQEYISYQDMWADLHWIQQTLESGSGYDDASFTTAIDEMLTSLAGPNGTELGDGEIPLPSGVETIIGTVGQNYGALTGMSYSDWQGVVNQAMAQMPAPPGYSMDAPWYPGSTNSAASSSTASPATAPSSGSGTSGSSGSSGGSSGSSTSKGSASAPNLSQITQFLSQPLGTTGIPTWVAAAGVLLLVGAL